MTVDRITGTITPLAGGTSTLDRHVADGALDQARFWAPYGLATNAAGNLLVLDRDNNRIRLIYTK